MKILLFCGIVLASAGCAAAQTAVVAQPEALVVDEALALAQAAGDLTPITCNGKQFWNATLRVESKQSAEEMLAELKRLGIEIPADKSEAARKAMTEILFWRQVRTTLIDGNYNNLGAIAIAGGKTADGKPLYLMRMGFTPQPQLPDSCFQSLVRAAQIRHVVNLYQGPIPTDDLEQGETATIAAVGGTYSSARDPAQNSANWREDLRQEDDAAAKNQAMQVVAHIINDLLLRPEGHAPKGNLLVHCGGGMHRTGMVVGVIERCVNRADPLQVAAHYKRHVAYRNQQDLGGFEQRNLDFIEHFDCSLIHPPQP